MPQVLRKRCNACCSKVDAQMPSGLPQLITCLLSSCLRVCKCFGWFKGLSLVQRLQPGTKGQYGSSPHVGLYQPGGLATSGLHVVGIFP